MALSVPTDEVDVCNLAQIKLKGHILTSIDPPSDDVEGMYALIYQQVRRATLRMGYFNFASDRKQITPDGATPPFGFSHKFKLPGNYITLKGVYTDNGRIKVRPEDMEIENGFILFNGTDNTSIDIKYIYDHVIVSKWDPLAMNLFVINLTIEMAARQGSQSNRTLDRWIAERKEYLTQARAVDGQERPPVRIQRSKFLDSRQTSGRVAGKVTDFGN